MYNYIEQIQKTNFNKKYISDDEEEETQKCSHRYPHRPLEVLGVFLSSLLRQTRLLEAPLIASQSLTLLQLSCVSET